MRTKQITNTRDFYSPSPLYESPFYFLILAEMKARNMFSKASTVLVAIKEDFIVPLYSVQMGLICLEATF